MAYNYSIGKYDVTVGQYTEFLNAVAATDIYGLYNTSMATDLNIAGIARRGSSGSYIYSVIGSAKHPVTYVSWGDAARFANWMSNGQPTGAEGTGTTETGSYTLNGATTYDKLNILTRNPDATWVIPTENEWYKAAYYNPATNSYYAYGSSSNSLPTSALPGSIHNAANIRSFLGSFFAVTQSSSYSSSQNYLTDVGAYTASSSPYGAFDMVGNVHQWNQSIFPNASYWGLRGGSWDDDYVFVGAAYREFKVFTDPQFSVAGFRMAIVPEPGTIALFGLGALGLLGYVLRRFAS